jgi:hypothetical protein
METGDCFDAAEGVKLIEEGILLLVLCCVGWNWVTQKSEQWGVAFG